MLEGREGDAKKGSYGLLFPEVPSALANMYELSSSSMEAVGGNIKASNISSIVKLKSSEDTGGLGVQATLFAPLLALMVVLASSKHGRRRGDWDAKEEEDEDDDEKTGTDNVDWVPAGAVIKSVVAGGSSASDKQSAKSKEAVVPLTHDIVGEDPAGSPAPVACWYWAFCADKADDVRGVMGVFVKADKTGWRVECFRGGMDGINLVRYRSMARCSMFFFPARNLGFNQAYKQRI